MLKLLIVHTEKGLPVILEESVQGAAGKPPLLIGHVRLSGDRVRGGIGRRLPAGGTAVVLAETP